MSAKATHVHTEGLHSLQRRGAVPVMKEDVSGFLLIKCLQSAATNMGRGPRTVVLMNAGLSDCDYHQPETVVFCRENVSGPGGTGTDGSSLMRAQMATPEWTCVAIY